MEEELFSRAELLIGRERLDKLRRSAVLVVGLGGVGGYAAECLARAGVGALTLVDGDAVQASNFNRQIIAVNPARGQNKAVVMARRVAQINPAARVNPIERFIAPEAVEEILFGERYDYIVDAVDTIAPKLEIIAASTRNHIPLVSSMGAGGKMDPLQARIADISESYNCRLARYIRKRLRKFNIHSGFKVVFSPEDVSADAKRAIQNLAHKKTILGTISYLPPIFGCLCASVVIRDLIER